MKPIELKDFLNYRFLSNVKYAPGGKKAAFVVSECCEEDNSYESRLWLYDGALRQLTDLGQERSFFWEDENCILFPASRSKAEKKRRESKEEFTSFYRLDLRGGEALPAFTWPFAAQRVEQVGEVYVATGSVDVHHPDYFQMDKEQRASVSKEREEETDYEVFDELPFWVNGEGVTNKSRAGLFTVSAQGQVRRVTEPLFSVDDFACLDGMVYYAGSAYDSKAPVRGFRLYRLNPATGQTALLGDYPGLSLSKLQAVGGELWLRAAACERHGLNENGWMYRVSLADGSLTVLREEETSMYGSVGSDCRFGGGQSWQSKGGSLYHITTREDSAVLYRLDGDGSSTAVVDKKGSIDCIALSEDADEALLVALYDNRLQELYAADLKSGEVRRLSRFNEEVLQDKYVADYQPLAIESRGEQIAGFVLLPKDYDPAKTYPAVLDIHGGPKTVYGPVFYHEMQLWASMGYFVFFCNPKGGDGRDNRFMDIRGHYGETDYENLMDFTDAVLKAWPQIDPARVCVTGGSYGGFMTNWIIGHTDRFCCAASQRSISNWLSFWGVSDIGFYFAADQCDASLYDSPEQLWRQSPVRYAANVKTPTLFIHSDEDYRCPLEQGLQMFTALKDRGVPSRLCLFHGETHELSRSGKPKHRARRLKEITDWFETYAKA